MGKVLTLATHRWSGWPGAYCMLCGQSDPVEYQIADDPYNTWMIMHLWACPPCPHVPYGVDPYSVTFPVTQNDGEP